MKWLTEQEVEKLKEVWADSSSEELKAIFPGRRFASLYVRARKLGLKSNIHKNSKGSIAPLLDGSHKSFYWLGFIIADGCLSNQNALSVCISIKDEVHLQKLAELLKTQIKNVTRSSIEFGSTTKAVSISVGDSILVPKIREQFGMTTTNKTYNPPILPEMSRHQFLSFLAGYIDGDGCIAKQGDYGKYKRKDVVIQVKCHSSWLKILCEMEERLYKELDLPLTKNHVCLTKKGYAFWKISNNQVIRRFKSELLGLNLPIMERKWSKILL